MTHGEWSTTWLNTQWVDLGTYRLNGTYRLSLHHPGIMMESHQRLIRFLYMVVER